MSATSDGLTVPPNMVAARGGLDVESPTLRSNRNPLVASTHIPQHLQFPMVKWRPRTGRSLTQQRFVISLHELLSALGVDDSFIHSSPPVLTPLRNTATRKDQQEYELRSAELTHWQTVNTSLFWHVRPALDWTGSPHTIRDEQFVASLHRGALADGGALVRKALTFIDQSSLEDQNRLRVDITGARMKVDYSCSQLVTFLRGLYEKWSLVSTNADAPVTEFWRRSCFSERRQRGGCFDQPGRRARKSRVESVELPTRPSSDVENAPSEANFRAAQGGDARRASRAT